MDAFPASFDDAFPSRVSSRRLSSEEAAPLLDASQELGLISSDFSAADGNLSASLATGVDESALSLGSPFGLPCIGIARLVPPIDNDQNFTCHKKMPARRLLGSHCSTAGSCAMS